MTRFLIVISALFLASACSANREPIPPQIIPVYFPQKHIEENKNEFKKESICKETSHETATIKEGK